MAKLPGLSSIISLFKRIKSKKRKQIDLKFEIGALPGHLVISILNKMPASTFIATYSTCHFVADLADRGRGRLDISLKNSPNLAIECVPKIGGWTGHGLVSLCYIIRIGYPVKSNPNWGEDSTLAIQRFTTDDINQIPQFLRGYSYFKFNRVAIWTALYAGKSKDSKRKLVSILRGEGISCCSLLVDEEDFVVPLVRAMKPLELEIRGGFDFERLEIPRLPKMAIKVLGFHPRSWEAVSQEILPICQKIELQIHEESRVTGLEAVDFIEKMFQLHHLKISVSLHLPRTILQEEGFSQLFSHLNWRMKRLDDLLLYPVPSAGACTVLLCDRGVGWLLRTFYVYEEMQGFLTSYKKYWRTNEKKRADLEHLLEEVEHVFKKRRSYLF